jgi:hypothetical protein
MLMLSYLDPQLLRVVHSRSLVSVSVSGDCYSVGYSVAATSIGPGLRFQAIEGQPGLLASHLVRRQPHRSVSRSY